MRVSLETNFKLKVQLKFLFVCLFVCCNWFCFCPLQHVIKEFGVNRCMFGSDWPVLLLAADSYKKVYETYMECVDILSDEAKQQVFCENGANFYNLLLD